MKISSRMSTTTPATRLLKAALVRVRGGRASVVGCACAVVAGAPGPLAEGALDPIGAGVPGIDSGVPAPLWIPDASRSGGSVWSRGGISIGLQRYSPTGRGAPRQRADSRGARPWLAARDLGISSLMATREQVRALLEQGQSYEAAARALRIPPGQAFMLATGLAADGSGAPPERELAQRHVPGSTQHLVNPPPFNPTRKEHVLRWVRERAANELTPAGG